MVARSLPQPQIVVKPYSCGICRRAIEAAKHAGLAWGGCGPDGNARAVVAPDVFSGHDAMRRDRTQLALICFPVVLALAAIITAVALYVTGPRRPMASQ